MSGTTHPPLGGTTQGITPQDRTAQGIIPLDDTLQNFSPHDVTLALPSWELRDSYVECLRDLQNEDPKRPVRWDWLENFGIYLAWCRAERERVEGPDGRGPETTYWIVIDGHRAVGRLTLRERLTPALRKIGGHFGYEIRPAYRLRGIAM